MFIGNLPPLEGQRSHMFIQDINSFPTMSLRMCRTNPLNTTECEHRGHSLSILRYERDNILVKLQYDAYGVKCDEDSRYYVTDIKTQQRDVIYDIDEHLAKVAIITLMFAHNPTPVSCDRLSTVIAKGILRSSQKTTGYMSFLEDLLHSKRNESDTGAHALKIDPVQYASAQSKRIAAASLNEYVNNTYVNFVHDCNRICAQPILGYSDHFVTHDTVEQHGMLCTHRLIELAQNNKESESHTHTDEPMSVGVTADTARAHTDTNITNVTITEVPETTQTTQYVPTVNTTQYVPTVNTTQYVPTVNTTQYVPTVNTTDTLNPEYTLLPGTTDSQGSDSTDDHYTPSVIVALTGVALSVFAGCAFVALIVKSNNRAAQYVRTQASRLSNTICGMHNVAQHANDNGAARATSTKGDTQAQAEEAALSESLLRGTYISLQQYKGNDL